MWKHDQRFTYISLESEKGKAMYSAVLLAYASGKQIGFGLDGCAPFDNWKSPKAYRVDVNG